MLSGEILDESAGIWWPQTSSIKEKHLCLGSKKEVSANSLKSNLNLCGIIQ